MASERSSGATGVLRLRERERERERKRAPANTPITVCPPVVPKKAKRAR